MNSNKEQTINTPKLVVALGFNLDRKVINHSGIVKVLSEKGEYDSN